MLGAAGLSRVPQMTGPSDVLVQDSQGGRSPDGMRPLRRALREHLPGPQTSGTAGMGPAVPKFCKQDEQGHSRVGARLWLPVTRPQGHQRCAEVTGKDRAARRPDGVCLGIRRGEC